MTREQFEQWLVLRGYQKNRFGHYVKKNFSDRRFKLSSNSVKLEGSYRLSEGSPLHWSRLCGNYYCNLSITSEGKLSGMTPNLLPPLRKIQ